jgi:hypothetical protein
MHPGPALGPRDAESLILREKIAGPDAEVEAAAGEDVEDGGVLRDLDRIMKRQNQDVGAEADAPRLAGDRAQDREQRRRPRVVAKVMFAGPDMTVAKLFGV